MAHAIMIQGTMSNAGKSLLAAGLCRIFHQDGYRVAPFKAQNMALNSFITREGLEMGRAQVMQAECAGIEPSVKMNPILLKPTNDTGSQVIVNGEVLGNMSARDYFQYKPKLIPVVKKAYDELAAENDIIVIEGAGSPAEINLKDADCFVNMGMAKIAGAPVLLVGDIDRGGVFAQLIGTVELLDPDERAMVKGLVINKFRGDKTILDPGITMLENMAGIPVVGVAPYMHIEVEDEDSLTERFDRSQEVGQIDIAVIRFPRISNFTDFNPFEKMNGVSLRYVDRVSELKNPDMIILPGTKNTMEDLLWMRQNGLEAEILKKATAGTVIFGVCGGYQMLGEALSDPMSVEAGGTIRGMGLIPSRTVFTAKKTRTRVTGHFGELGGTLSGLSGTELEGYEIHMGATMHGEGVSNMTVIEDTNPGSGNFIAEDEESTFFNQENIEEIPENASEEEPAPNQEEETAADGSRHKLHHLRHRKDKRKWKNDGAQYGNVYGTYVHGCFDKEMVADRIVQCLGRKKGIDTSHMTGVDYQTFKMSQYDILADTLRKNMDMEKIYDILRKGV